MTGKDINSRLQYKRKIDSLTFNVGLVLTLDWLVIWGFSKQIIAKILKKISYLIDWPSNQAISLNIYFLVVWISYLHLICSKTIHIKILCHKDFSLK